jgi:hypothetical protein
MSASVALVFDRFPWTVADASFGAVVPVVDDEV